MYLSPPHMFVINTYCEKNRCLSLMLLNMHVTSSAVTNYYILEDHQKRGRQRAQFSYKIMFYFQLNIITINRNDTFYVILTSPCALHSTTSPLDSFTIVICRSSRLRYTQTQSRDFVQSEPGPRVTLTPVKQIHKSQH